MPVLNLRHDEIGRVVAQHDKTGMHSPVAQMYESWKSGADPQCPVRSQNMVQQLLGVLTKDGKFSEAPKLKGPPGTSPGVDDGRTRLFAAYEYSMANPDFTLEVVIP